MKTLLATRVQDWWGRQRQEAKMRRGRCRMCKVILRDDQRDLCSAEQCREGWEYEPPL